MLPDLAALLTILLMASFVAVVVLSELWRKEAYNAEDMKAELRKADRTIEELRVQYAILWELYNEQSRQRVEELDPDDWWKTGPPEEE